MAEDYSDVSPYNYALNNPVNNTDPNGMSVEYGPQGLYNDYNFGPDGKLDNVVIKPGPDHFYQTDKDGKRSELNGSQLTHGMSAQYLYASSLLAPEGVQLNEVVIKGKKQVDAYTVTPYVPWNSSMGEAGIEMSFPIEGLFPGLKAFSVVSSLINLSNGHVVLSKGGNRNIWPDQYGYPPRVKDVDWKRSDGELADEKSKAIGDKKRGQGTPNNMARKWFRDKRPK